MRKLLLIHVTKLEGDVGFNMSELSSVVELLGKDNEKRLKDGITDLLLQQFEHDLEDKYKYDYIVSFDSIFDEVKREIEEDLKMMMITAYKEKFEKRLEKLLREYSE